MTLGEDRVGESETETRGHPNRRTVLKAVGASALLGNIGIIGMASALDDPADQCQNDLKKRIEWAYKDNSWIEVHTPTGIPDVYSVTGDGRNVTFCNNSDIVGGTSYTVYVRTQGGQCLSEFLRVRPGECIDFTAKLGDRGDDPAPYITCENNDRNPTFDNIKGCVKSSTPNPCKECVTNTQLVKYEWDNKAGELVVVGSPDPYIRINSVELDEDGEPKRICLYHKYCKVKFVVKGGPEIYKQSDSTGYVCLTEVPWKKNGRPRTAAISNFTVYCA